MAKQKFKITNWPTYNKALINRGSITFWLDDEAIQAWYESATPSSRGRPQRYSDLAITTVLVIKRVFRLTLRAAQGFIDSIFSLMNVPLRCPDYSCVSRRAKSVNISFKTPTRGEIAHLVIDSTGLKVFGKFVDALRATAARMSMQDLQDARENFVQGVQNTVAEDLSKNGLELESVSLTSFNQTARVHFNPDNAFDAEGLTLLTQETERRRRERNEVEQDVEVAIREKNRDALSRRLEIEQQEAFMTLEQQQRVKTRTAEQSASIAAIEAERRREAESARILAERKIEEAEIERQQIVRTRQVEAEREVAIREIEQQQATEIASQARAIAVAAKSEEQSQAEARASKALAEAVQAQQDVETTRQTAEADRTKQVALIAAAQEAETKAVELTVRAQAEKEAAELQAAAIIELAEATRQKGLAEAEAQRALNDAINVLSDEQTSLRFRLALLDALPAVIEKSTEPMKSIDGIKIIQVDGLNGGVTRGKTATTDISGGNLAEQAETAALAYRTQAPLIDSLLKEVGLSGEGLTALTRPLVMPAPEKVPDVSEPVTAPDNSEPQQV